MKLLEYEAKALLRNHGIAVPKSYIAGDEPEFLPVVLKSQVPVGGRGKAGGIAVVENADSFKSERTRISQLRIKDFTPKRILAEEKLAVARELYLSLLIDKASASILVMAHPQGGIEVEENSASEFLRMAVTSSNADTVGQQLADLYDLPDKTFILQDMIEKLRDAFIKEDMTLLEINPLILTEKGGLIAGDAKVILDDAAHFRHTEWQFEDEKAETNFVTLDPDGNVATIANGAGLAMATVDGVADSGLTPANFLDIGGGASEASVLAAFRRIAQYPGVKVIVINIFAGITHCDEVARAIIAAQAQIDTLPPLAIRLAGTNYDEAAVLLSEQGIPMHENLRSAIESARSLV